MRGKGIARYGAGTKHSREGGLDPGVAPEEEELAGTPTLLVGVRHHRPIPVSILDDPACLIDVVAQAHPLPPASSRLKTHGADDANRAIVLRDLERVSGQREKVHTFARPAQDAFEIEAQGQSLTNQPGTGYILVRGQASRPADDAGCGLVAPLESIWPRIPDLARATSPSSRSPWSWLKSGVIVEQAHLGECLEEVGGTRRMGRGGEENVCFRRGPTPKPPSC